MMDTVVMFRIEEEILGCRVMEMTFVDIEICT